MKYSKTAAKETIDSYKNLTCFFDESMSRNNMYECLRHRCHFGDAETRVIIAALVIAGAKFTEE